MHACSFLYSVIIVKLFSIQRRSIILGKVAIRMLVPIVRLTITTSSKKKPIWMNRNKLNRYHDSSKKSFKGEGNYSVSELSECPFKCNFNSYEEKVELRVIQIRVFLHQLFLPSRAQNVFEMSSFRLSSLVCDFNIVTSRLII